ncbi:hypothetical protein [Pseudobacteroides cellulosolvens]|uniref:Uncharacterized protein n=1 Tax=Pseudobacteroides cellulosolvens ATCC 35603 = DSM 2933 TaxID=398512 RepID=A0A0L6JKL3_9FIRM|nr:hypothetical protein [Pseudobacteroides cellulosolvens]KNY25922.1 hypothetical protein Bccel_1182 [Pseudobacteroides cellulosolvens ATCC 35603 = DSM 2933]
MKVFDLKDFKPCAGPQNQVVTPLGKVCFSLKLGKTDLADFTSAFTNKKGDYVFGWYSDSFDVELLICSPKLHLADNMHVEGCRAAIYRILLHDKELACEFSANWCSDYLWTDGGPDSGEHLEAQTCENDYYVVSIGTQDGEMLHSRAMNNEMMPAILNSSVDPLALVECSSTGLLVPIERVFLNQVCQVHFVVAWTPKKPDDVSTWYAVDMSHREFPGCLLG